MRRKAGGRGEVRAREGREESQGGDGMKKTRGTREREEGKVSGTW